MWAVQVASFQALNNQPFYLPDPSMKVDYQSTSIITYQAAVKEASYSIALGVEK